jgi:F-type H+-transporting ATPase subunit delta
VAQSSSAAQIADRYAAALIETADEAGVLSSIETDIADLSAMLDASAEFRDFVALPGFQPEKQDAALRDLSARAGFHGLTVNFLRLLSGNRRLSILRSVIVAFQAAMSTRKNQIKAHVKAAAPMTGEQQESLRHQLATALSRDVVLDIGVDPTLIGGLVVTIGSRQIDDSVKAKLEKLRQTLTTSNQNNILKEAG